MDRKKLTTIFPFLNPILAEGQTLLKAVKSENQFKCFYLTDMVEPVNSMFDTSEKSGQTQAKAKSCRTEFDTIQKFELRGP